MDCCGGGAFLLVFILIAGIIAGAAFSSSSENSESLSDEVLAYTSVIQQYASQYGIPEYVSAIQAIMMQESGEEEQIRCSVRKVRTIQGFHTAPVLLPIRIIR